MMRIVGTTFVALLAAAALAQSPGGNDPRIIAAPRGTDRSGPAGQPALDPNNRLDSILMKWNERMKKTETIYLENCSRIDRDRSGSKTWTGEIRFKKPNLFALLLIQKEDKKFYEMLISDGKALYEYRPQFKKLVIHELPPVQAGQFDNNVLALLFGNNAADVKRRYDLKITKDNASGVYIELTPRATEDKREFTRAELLLHPTNLTPLRLWFEQPNGNEVTWNLPNFNTSQPMTIETFRAPQPKSDWEVVRVPFAGAKPDAKPGNNP